MDARDRQVARETVRPRSECHHCNPPDLPPLDPARFPPEYRLRMIRAYPVIADLAEPELYGASMRDLDVAFDRILAARNLRRTHELYLEERDRQRSRP